MAPISQSNPDRADAGASRYRVQVIERSCNILDALSAHPERLSPAALAARLRLHKSTVHRLLRVLEHEKLVRKNVNGKYGLGAKILEMAGRAMQQFDIGAEAMPILQQLVEQTGETAHVAVLSGDETVSIASLQGRWALRLPASVGRRSPAYCTSVGKAILAFLSEHEVRSLLSRTRLQRFTRHTLTSLSGLNAHLKIVRKRGYAVDDEEREEGLRCIGAPVRDYTGRVVAAISIAGPGFRVRKQRVPELSRLVIRATNEFSRELGYVPPVLQV